MSGMRCSLRVLGVRVTAAAAAPAAAANQQQAADGCGWLPGRLRSSGMLDRLSMQVDCSVVVQSWWPRLRYLGKEGRWRRSYVGG